MGFGNEFHRDDIKIAIGADVPLNFTSIRDGMNMAATEHDNSGTLSGTPTEDLEIW
ncbi:MAG: hypothetical protein QNJ45_01110 [Ardenticatenaceae bacterium]|nr:hypothetical protein [Ardenticatenaceae bacterium]